jgi:hypothetical protein
MAKEKNRWLFWGEIAIEVLIVLVIIFWTRAFTVAKLIANIFLPGRSSIKVYLFFLFIILLRRIYYIKRDFTNNPVKKHLIVVGILFALGLFEFFIYFNSFFLVHGLPMGNFTRVYMPPNDQSVSHLFHTHNAKVVFGYPMSALHLLSETASFDAGASFIDFYPNPKNHLFQQLSLYCLFLLFLLLSSFYLLESEAFKICQ